MSRIADFLDRLMRRKVPASVFVTMNPQMQAVRIAVRETDVSLSKIIYANRLPPAPVHRSFLTTRCCI